MFSFRVWTPMLVLCVMLIPGVRAQQLDDCQTRSVLIGFRNEGGSVVTGLTNSAFHAEMNHKPVKIISVIPYHDLPRTILLIDTSGSMSHHGKWRIAADFAYQFVAQMPSDAQVAFAAFSEHVNESVAFTSGRHAVLEEIQELRNLSPAKRKGSTAILDTILKTIDWFGEPRTRSACR